VYILLLVYVHPNFDFWLCTAYVIEAGKRGNGPRPDSMRTMSFDFDQQEEGAEQAAASQVPQGVPHTDVQPLITQQDGFLASPNSEELPPFKWTKTHGFFLQMGGFMLQSENGREKRVLGWKTFMNHYKLGEINLSDITEARINDHSKADGFAKGLALLQTCWFIIQCIAHFSDSKLVLTEIELVTAALAVLSLVMYFLWWNKPFNAEIPIVITLCAPQNRSSIRQPDVNRQTNVTGKEPSFSFTLSYY